MATPENRSTPSPVASLAAALDNHRAQADAAKAAGEQIASEREQAAQTKAGGESHAAKP